MTEQQLRAIGALKDTCTERASRICLMCGTAMADAGEWERNGNQCVACGNETYRDECPRCRGECPGASGSHPCASVAMFRGTGRIAFPEKVAEATKHEEGRTRDSQRPPPESVPPLPPVLAAIGRAIAGIGRRYRGVLGKYAVFEGRSGPKDFWSFMVGQAVGLAVCGVFGAEGVFLLITAIPTWAVAVRRLHDLGASGHWLWLLGAVPLGVWQILALVPLVMFLCPGSNDRNRYGDPPA